MPKVLLDTDILSEYLKGHDRIVTGHAARYAQQYGIFTFTSITVYEIVYGLEVKEATAQLKKALAWLNQNEQILPERGDYLAAASIKATARRQGAVLELPDCLIAAVTVRLDCSLVTGNTEDFEAYPKNEPNWCFKTGASHRRTLAVAKRRNANGREPVRPASAA